MKRWLALTAALGLLSGCAFLERLAGPGPAAPQSGTITLSGTAPASAVYLVEPQVTVITPPRAVPVTQGASLYAGWCMDCHGAEARGFGRVSGQMTVKPTDLTTLALNNGGTFPARRVIGAMQGAGAYHRGLMPEIGGALDGPLVEWIGPDGTPHLTTQSTMDLIVYLENLQV